MNEELYIIRTTTELRGAMEKMKEAEYVAYDTETTGLDQDTTIIGYSFAFDPQEAYYVITHYWDKEKQELIDIPAMVDATPAFLNLLKTKSLIMHNATFDCSRTKHNYGICLKDSVHTDTLVLSHLLNENRSPGLKELGYSEFGATATDEQKDMKASIIANGGKITRDCYELYKADADKIARYGAKDALLTLHLFYHFVPELLDSELDKFFYEEECMPLLKGPTYDMNTVGMKLDVPKMQDLQTGMTQRLLELEEKILTDIAPYIKEKYPNTSKKTKFNINSNAQISWLLFIKLDNEYKNLTNSGRELAKNMMDGKVPYSRAHKKKFLQEMIKAGIEPQKYLKCDVHTLNSFKFKYQWVANLLEYKKESKLLKTYVIGIQNKVKYGIIHPSFLQHGTTSGRYSSRTPNFQNLPRDDKRIKDCILSRPGHVLVGADYSQLEPRVFASFAQDHMLLDCFNDPDNDFYSVVGIPVFGKYDCSPNKKAPNFFGTKHKALRQIAKAIALAVTYGTTANKLVTMLKDEEENPLSIELCQKIIDDYLDAYPGVHKFMMESHKQAMNNGVVYNIFGRPRRIPEAKKIKKYYSNVSHGELPYELRSLLNLSTNHRVQSTAASIVNRSMIAFYERARELKLDAKIVLQVHDSICVECPEGIAEEVAALLKDCMENTVQLPGVALVAEPDIGTTLAALK